MLWLGGQGVFTTGGRAHRSLKQLLPNPDGKRLYQQRTPAMAIGLADKIWNVVDLLRFPVYPSASRV
jgi:hypothetical protein